MGVLLVREVVPEVRDKAVVGIFVVLEALALLVLVTLLGACLGRQVVQRGAWVVIHHVQLSEVIASRAFRPIRDLLAALPMGVLLVREVVPEVRDKAVVGIFVVLEALALLVLVTLLGACLGRQVVQRGAWVVIHHVQVGGHIPRGARVVGGFGLLNDAVHVEAQRGALRMRAWRLGRRGAVGDEADGAPHT